MDKNAYGERRIRWLSPALPTRNEAYRCEWALKQYRDEANGRFPGTYDEVVTLSSIPVVVFRSAGLDYDAGAGRMSFDLSWDLSDKLGPSQIVPVSFYELQRYDARRARWVTVALGSESEFRGHLSLDLIGNWRARAVNFDDIPGPWTDFAVSEDDLALSVQKLVRVADVTAELLDLLTGEVLVGWSVSMPVPGVHYELERKGSDGSYTVTDAGSAMSFRETVIAHDPSTYQYRVRAVLDSVRGMWESGGTRSRCVVGGGVPGPVIGLSANCRADGSVDLLWGVPEWIGHNSIQGYGVEITPAGNPYEYIRTHNANSWYDADSTTDYLCDVSYRVHPWNSIGSGPWSEPVHISWDERRQAVFQALPSALQLQVDAVGTDWFSFRWASGDSNLSYDIEVESHGHTTVYRADVPHFAVPVDWSMAALLTCRVRAVLRGIIGEWSAPVCVGLARDYERASQFVLPKGVHVGFVVIDSTTDYRVVAVWSGIDDSFLNQGRPDLGVPLLARVTSRNKGGLEASWGGLRCFIPASRVRGGKDQLDSMVGKFICLSALELRVRHYRLRRRTYAVQRELVCTEAPLATPQGRPTGPDDSKDAKEEPAAVTRRLSIGSIVIHRSLGRGTVLWLGERSAKVKFSNDAELGSVLCLVRDLKQCPNLSSEVSHAKP